ncbi:O-antigen ligase family protein [candidate division KSB1 bacterium]|nr:O-antigen ligase family protein [candidate division KSB1 bacterium]RQW01917.1 MAG: O-antigen ligase family protein [candidate division KSB1 bacterium]
MNLNKSLLIAFGFLLSIEQGFTLVLGVLSSGVARGADVLMPVDVAMYSLFLFKPAKPVPIKYRGLYVFAITLGVLFLFWSFIGEFFAVESADFRFGIVHLTRSILIYLCILTRVSTKQDIVDLTLGILFGLAFEAVIGFWQWQFGPVFLPFLNIVNDWRATGTLKVGNAFGCYLALLTPIAIRMALFTRIKPKWLWYTISALSLGALLATYSRGAWFAFTASMVFFFTLDIFRKKLTPRQIEWLIVVFVVAVTFTSIKYGHVITGRMANSREALVSEKKHSRLGFAQDALRIIKRYPITGVGLENYRYHADKEIQGTRIVHNAYLLIAAQQGLPGLAIFILLNFTIFIYGFKIRNSQDVVLYHLGMAAMTGMFALFIYHLAAPDYRLVIINMHHWRALAVIVAFLIADERIRSSREQMLLRKKRQNSRALKSSLETEGQQDEAALQKY